MLDLLRQIFPMSIDVLGKLDKLHKHIEHVQESCRLLAEDCILHGRKELGIALMKNAAVHDNSKFSGLELKCLVLEEIADPEVVKLAVTTHNTTNLHHPEAWDGGIKEMSELYLMEAVSDWRARSTEFGTDLRGWITNSATDKFSFKKGDRVFKDIQRYLRIILDVPFKKL